MSKEDIKIIFTQIKEKSKEHLDGDRYIKVEDVVKIIKENISTN